MDRVSVRDCGDCSPLDVDMQWIAFSQSAVAVAAANIVMPCEAMLSTCKLSYKGNSIDRLEPC